MTKDVKKISTVQNVDMLDCVENGCDVGPAILRDVSIHNLETRDLFILWSPFFDRVTLSGVIGKTKINASAHFSIDGKEQQPFNKFRDKFYRKVDWALDIRKAKFKQFEVYGVPGHLIKRDPETQILITRERALEIVKPGWADKLECTVKWLPSSIEWFLSSGEKDEIWVAPMAAPKATRDPILKGLQEFRKIGLAEPD